MSIVVFCTILMILGINLGISIACACALQTAPAMIYFTVSAVLFALFPFYTNNYRNLD